MAKDADTDAPEEEVTEESLQTDHKIQAPQESEQAQAKQPPDSADTSSQKGDDNIAEQKKNEQI